MYDFSEKITNKEQLTQFIERHTHVYNGKFVIHDDLTVDVDGDVELSKLNLKIIPCQFGEVSGNFNCSKNLLTSLEGVPRVLKGAFFCNNNQLTSLTFCPNEVRGNFDCSYNLLSSLKGGPQSLQKDQEYGHYNCSHNPITELSHLPQQVDNFYCKNTHITSLKNSPQIVTDLHAEYNERLSLLQLEGVSILDTLYLDDNPNLKNLTQGPLFIGQGLILPSGLINTIFDINFSFSFIQQTLSENEEQISELKNFYKKINKTELSYYYRLELNYTEFEMLKLHKDLNDSIHSEKNGKKQKI